MMNLLIGPGLVLEGGHARAVRVHAQMAAGSRSPESAVAIDDGAAMTVVAPALDSARFRELIGPSAGGDLSRLFAEVARASGVARVDVFTDRLLEERVIADLVLGGIEIVSRPAREIEAVAVVAADS